MSAFGRDENMSPEAADATADPNAIGAAGRLPRLRPFDLATFRDEPRPAMVPPLVTARDDSRREDLRQGGPARRLPSCGDVILGPAESLSRPAAQTPSRAQGPASAPRRRFRPGLLAAGLAVATLALAAPVVLLQLDARSGAPTLFEGRSASNGVLATASDGVPVIAADPRPFKVAAPPQP